MFKKKGERPLVPVLSSFNMFDISLCISFAYLSDSFVFPSLSFLSFFFIFSFFV